MWYYWLLLPTLLVPEVCCDRTGVRCVGGTFGQGQNEFLFLVVRPGAPSSVLVPSRDALCS